MAPIGIVSQIFFNTSGFGPPAANVPAHETKIAQGGRCDGVKIVVAASSEATISAGSFFMAFPLTVRLLVQSDGGWSCASYC